MSQRGLRWGALLLLMALPGVPAHARAHHSRSLGPRPLCRRGPHARGAERTSSRRAHAPRLPARHQCLSQRLLGAPTSTKADPSAVAVAETLVEMGRRFDDDKILNKAIAQYKFLRREYPGSKYRCDALFTDRRDLQGRPERSRAGPRSVPGVSETLSAQPTRRRCAAGDCRTRSPGQSRKEGRPQEEIRRGRSRGAGSKGRMRLRNQPKASRQE